MILPVADAAGYFPPGSPVVPTETYWGKLLVAADAMVKQICGRQLEAAEYVERGDVLTEVIDGTTRYCYWPVEHIRSITSIEVNDNALTADDYEVRGDCVLLNGSGRIAVTYDGGYATDSAELDVLRSAVAAAVEVMHETRQSPGLTSRSAAGESLALDADPYAGVRRLVAPYIRYRMTLGPEWRDAT